MWVRGCGDARKRRWAYGWLVVLLWWWRRRAPARVCAYLEGGTCFWLSHMNDMSDGWLGSRSTSAGLNSPRTPCAMPSNMESVPTVRRHNLKIK